MKTYKFYSAFLFLALFSFNLFCIPFNEKLTSTEQAKLQKGEVLIKNIDTQPKMCLDPETDAVCAKIVQDVKDYSPRYLAEIIQIKPYKGNEDLPKKMAVLLNNIGDYAGIPYWSERHERYFDLYSSAKITKSKKEANKTYITAQLEMDPFGLVEEEIYCEENPNSLYYSAVNTTPLKFEGITGVKKGRLKIYIYCVHIDDYWYIYGIGGVNAPKIPFLTERIRVSFINRIKTFCNFIFTKL